MLQFIKNWSRNKVGWNIVKSINWQRFNKLLADFWNLDLAKSYITIRESLGSTVMSLNSQQRSISLDLMATGIACETGKMTRSHSTRLLSIR